MHQHWTLHRAYARTDALRLRLLSHLLTRFIRNGTLRVIAADGTAHRFGGHGPGPSVTLRLHDAGLYTKLFLNPELHADEAYMGGTLTFEDGSDVGSFMELFAANRGGLAAHPAQALLRRGWRAMKGIHQANPAKAAKANARHHYDLSTDLYRLFLDEGLNYSCAVFEHPSDTLEAAAAKGVSDLIEFRELDYRELQGRFDRVVSVGMMEHVGVGHFDERLGKIRGLLAPDGFAFVHCIGRMRPPGSTAPFIRKHIFPGAYVPSLSEVFASTERAGLWAADMEVLRLHYHHTLQHWRRRFAANRARAAELYDERFCRMWDWYLAAVDVGFSNGSNMVLQLLLSERTDAVPVLRDCIVDDLRAGAEAVGAGAGKVAAPAEVLVAEWRCPPAWGGFPYGAACNKVAQQRGPSTP